MSLQMASQLVIMQRVLASLLSLKVNDQPDWMVAINKVWYCAVAARCGPHHIFLI